jgi:hypothetical protein
MKSNNARNTGTTKPVNFNHLSKMSLLFIHLVEDDFPAFDRELNRDRNELMPCLAEVNKLRDYTIFKRLENFVTQSLGKEYSIKKRILRLVSDAARAQHPHAQPGDDITVQVSDSTLHLRVMPDGTYRQSVEQMMESFDLSRERVETHVFQQQLDRVGTVDRGEYLDITEDFHHPLSECEQHGKVLIINAYAGASLIIRNGYLSPSQTDDNGVLARASFKELGLHLSPEIEQQLRDRHKPTIYQVCTQLVDRLTNLSER